MKRKRCI